MAMKNRIDLTPARRAAVRALLEAGVTQPEIVASEHMSYTTIQDIKNDPTLDKEKTAEIVGNLAGIFYHKANLALSFVTEEKLKASSAAQLMTIGAIAVDKGQLLSGKPTMITEYTKFDDKDLMAQLKVLEAELVDLQAIDAKPIEARQIEHDLSNNAK